MSAQPSLFDPPLPAGWTVSLRPVMCHWQACRHGRVLLGPKVEHERTIEQRFRCETCGCAGHTSTRKDLLRKGEES